MSAGKLAAKPCGKVIAVSLYVAAMGVLLLAIAGIDQLRAGSPRSPLANAYCKIPTFVIPVLRGEARALLENGINPIILVDATTLERRNYMHFLLAHECCHHKLGHLTSPLRKKKNQTPHKGLPAGGPAPRAVFSPRSSSASRHQIEIEADCCAARQLALLGDADALAAAIKAMNAFGPKSTGPAYPSGVRRAAALKLCAGLE